MKRIVAVWLTMLSVAAFVLVGGTSAPAMARDGISHSQCVDFPMPDNHRGAFNNVTGPTEDTVEAYQKTFRLGGKGIEGDIRPTKDGKLVDMHDSTLNRTTKGHGKVIKLTYARIRKVRTNTGERVPSLQSVLSWLVKHPSMHGQLEGKVNGTHWTTAEMQQFAGAIVADHLQSRMTITSGSRSWLRRFGELPGMSDVQLLLLGFARHQPNLSQVPAGVSVIGVTDQAAFRPYGSYQTYIQAVHAQGLQIAVRFLDRDGSGDNPHMWAREMRAGANYILVNHVTRWNSFQRRGC
jgi:glycerophosphoryl diester phosphodiesterase